MEHETESKFYVIAKALMILGDKVQSWTDDNLDGDRIMDMVLTLDID